MKVREKTIDDYVKGWFLGVWPHGLYKHEIPKSSQEVMSNWAQMTESSAVGIMRRAIAGAKYKDTLTKTTKDNYWDNTGLQWLEANRYLVSYDGIYLPSPSGIDWFNHTVEGRIQS